MYLKTRLYAPGQQPWSGEVPDGATLGDVIEAAGVDTDTLVLSQNGHRAEADDPVKPDSLVMLSPRAQHG